MLHLNLTRRRHKTWSSLATCLFKGPPDSVMLVYACGISMEISELRVTSRKKIASLSAKKKWNCRGCQLQKWHCWNNVCGRTARGYFNIKSESGVIRCDWVSMGPSAICSTLWVVQIKHVKRKHNIMFALHWLCLIHWPNIMSGPCPRLEAVLEGIELLFAGWHSRCRWAGRCFSAIQGLVGNSEMRGSQGRRDTHQISSNEQLIEHPKRCF